MSDIENLWGDLTEFPDMDLPKDILDAQKEHLEAALGGMVLAEVRQSNPSGKVKVSFVVYPSNYEDMEQEILSITHDIRIYPAMIRNCLDPNAEEKAASDVALKQIVRRVLSNNEAHHIVNKMRLLSMSK